jgi:hypothetical protein
MLCLIVVKQNTHWAALLLDGACVRAAFAVSDSSTFSDVF